jgi:diguanylate cyclase (GGDEF)-like protein
MPDSNAVPPAPLSGLRKDVRPLGEALKARAEDVLKLTGDRIRGLGHGNDALVQGSFERINRNSTLALALWLAGEGPEVTRQAGRETWHLYGELAAHRAASLQEVTERCLCWRDSVAEVLHQSADERGVSAEALSQALNILQIGLEFSLVRMCKSFDKECERTDKELARRDEQLAFLGTHDALTGLPNRALILDRVEQMFARSARGDTHVAALSIDIDNLTAVNDTLGRSAGDELLQAAASRLDDALRGADAIGRFGAGEFVVICEGQLLGEEPEGIAQRLLDALKPPFTLGATADTSFTVSASIGIATGRRDSAEELLRDADVAMHRAKWEGKNGYAVFEAGMQDSVQQRVELEMDLRYALERNEFFLVYQPTFALRDLTPMGVEALIRWKHPLRGVVKPKDFIPLAEEAGLIGEIGKWVLEQACTQGAAWREAGYTIGVAVNVSARQLDSDQLLADVENALAASGLDASALTLEITETALVRNVEETVRRLLAIKGLGARVAIDDFGTGYSSLAHLQRFPVDALKIDRSFIAGLGQSGESETFIRALVQMGRALSLETVAEGIDREEQLAKLQDEDCESGQGYLLGRPLDAARIEAFLSNAATEDVGV